MLHTVFFPDTGILTQFPFRRRQVLLTKPKLSSTTFVKGASGGVVVKALRY